MPILIDDKEIKGNSFQEQLQSVVRCRCAHCGKIWIPRQLKLPYRCPNPACSTPFWNDPLVTTRRERRDNGNS